MESMTGFGSAEAVLDGFAVTASARSVNHRGLSVVPRFPRELACLEEYAHGSAKELFGRGRIELTLSLEPGKGPGGTGDVDMEMARSWVQTLERLAGSFRIEPGTTAFGLLSMPGVLRLPDPTRSGDFPGVVRDVIKSCLIHLRESRIREGRGLSVFFRDSLSSLLEGLKPVSEGHGERVREAFGKSRNRVRELLGDAELDQARLVQEIALMADRLDVSEECQRLEYHAREALLVLDGDTCGMRLVFLIQEMQRELNTMGAKLADPDTAHRVIGMKELVGNMKEQAANVQ